MMLTSQAQKIVLVLSSFLINLFFNTGDAYYNKFKLKAYNDTLKKHHYSILDYNEVEFFHPPML